VVRSKGFTPSPYTSSPYNQQPLHQQPHPRAPLHPTQETSWRIHRSGPREHSEGREHEPSGAKFRVVGLVLTLLSLVAGQLCHAALVPQCLGRRACTAHITGECAALRALPLGDGEERDENLTVGLVLWGFLDLCPFTVAHYLRPCLPWRTTFDPVYRGALPSTLFTVAHYPAHQSQTSHREVCQHTFLVILSNRIIRYVRYSGLGIPRSRPSVKQECVCSSSRYSLFMSCRERLEESEVLTMQAVRKGPSPVSDALRVSDS
jgi:hypothetical protein